MIRSLLYVPASSERFIAKAHLRGAHAVILDLEDSVEPNRKTAAREALAEAVPAVGQNGATVFVRINSTEERAVDDALAACRAGAFGLFVPKAHSVAMNSSRSGRRRWRRSRREGGAASRCSFVAVARGSGRGARRPLHRHRAPRVFGLICGIRGPGHRAWAPRRRPTYCGCPSCWSILVGQGGRACGLVRGAALGRQLLGHRRHRRRRGRGPAQFGFDGSTCIHPKRRAGAECGPSLPRPKRRSSGPSGIDRRRRDRPSPKEGRGAFAFEGAMVDKHRSCRTWRDALFRNEKRRDGGKGFPERATTQTQLASPTTKTSTQEVFDMTYPRTFIQRRLAAGILAVDLRRFGATAADFPSRGLEFVACYSPGGGHDILMRTMAKIIQQEKIVDASINVVNKPGGAGAVALGYVNGHKGDGHYLMATTSSFITTPLTSNVGLSTTPGLHADRPSRHRSRAGPGQRQVRLQVDQGPGGGRQGAQRRRHRQGQHRAHRRHPDEQGLRQEAQLRAVPERRRGRGGAAQPVRSTS